MTPNDCLRMTTALRLHFTSPDYDYIKYNGKLRKDPDFSKRNDKFQIQKVARHSDPFSLVLANISIKPTAWFSEFVSDHGLQVYEDWRKRNTDLVYTFRNDIKEFNNNLVDDFRVNNGQHPQALKRYLGGHISLETLSIMNVLTNFWQHWNNNLKDDLIWREMSLMIPKYQVFLRFNKMSIKQIIKEKQSACE